MAVTDWSTLPGLSAASFLYYSLMKGSHEGLSHLSVKMWQNYEMSGLECDWSLQWRKIVVCNYLNRWRNVHAHSILFSLLSSLISSVYNLVPLSDKSKALRPVAPSVIVFLQMVVRVRWRPLVKCNEGIKNWKRTNFYLAVSQTWAINIKYVTGNARKLLRTKIQYYTNGYHL